MAMTSGEPFAREAVRIEGKGRRCGRRTKEDLGLLWGGPSENPKPDPNGPSERCVQGQSLKGKENRRMMKPKESSENIKHE